MSEQIPLHTESQASSLLAAIEAKLADGPRVALGLPPLAGQAEVRQAFLRLTKTFHPNRYARFSAETQKRANEAFLAIKRAHDELMRGDKPAPPRAATVSVPPLSVRPPSTTVPPVAGSASGQDRKPLAPVAAAVRSKRPSALPQWLPPGAGRAKSTSAPPTARVTQPPRLEATRSSGSVATHGASAGQEPAPAGVPGASASTAQPRTRSADVPGPPKPALSAGSERPPQKLVSPEDALVHEAKLALDQQRWRDADALYSQLAVAQPAEKKHRVLRHFVRGRMAQEEGKVADARQEYERALALDATYAPARIALSQLPTEGLFGKLFRR